MRARKRGKCAAEEKEAGLASDWECDEQMGWSEEDGEDFSFQSRRRGIGCHCRGTLGG